jgi:NAD(P)-dependent dehydrogenase (short-subunit alcohol dehydrogenase family)
MPTSRSMLALGGVAALVAAGLTLRNRRFRLAGKVVMLTGGSRGLGLVLARELARRGARIVLIARDGAELGRARADLMARGANDVLVMHGDVTDPGRMREVVDAVLDLYGRVDVLVNNAGDIEVGPFEAMRFSDFERAMATHFWAPLNLGQALHGPMRAAGGGRIANVSSVGGVVAPPHLLPYVASKFALTGLSLGLSAELAKDGILVTTVFPGLMRTGSTENALFKGNRAAEYGWFAVSDALPLLSSSAERAARRIVRAIERGDAVVTITPAARFARIAQGIAPNLVVRTMRLMNRLLPRSSDPTLSHGYEARSPRMPRWLTALSDAAAKRNNEQIGR